MGTLYLVSTPIGNLDDISIRAIKILINANIIVAEDTRHSGNLISEVKKKFPELIRNELKSEFISYYDEIEFKRIPQIIQRLENNEDIVFISDSGTPLISDPGYKLVNECLKRNIKVDFIPGPTAAIAAFVLSGLPYPFTFMGFPPEKQSNVHKLLVNIKSANKYQSTTVIFYISPHKIIRFLENLDKCFGNIDIVIARELTKIHQQIFRGTISQALTDFPNPKGEFVFLFKLQYSSNVEVSPIG